MTDRETQLLAAMENFRAFIDARLEEVTKEIVAAMYPCPVCHSTAWEHDCPPPTKPLLGLAGFIDDH